MRSASDNGIPVVVTLHLEVEDLGLGAAGGWDEVGVEQGEDAVADAGELGLDLGAVGADGGGVRLVPAALLLLLDGGDDPPRGPAGADDVLVGDGQQVALLHEELPPPPDFGELIRLYALDFLIERLHIGCTVYDGEKERGETPTLASRRAAIRPWRESRRLLIMRSLVWYSTSLRKWMLLLPRVDARGATRRQVGSTAQPPRRAAAGADRGRAARRGAAPE